MGNVCIAIKECVHIFDFVFITGFEVWINKSTAYIVLKVSHQVPFELTLQNITSVSLEEGVKTDVQDPVVHGELARELEEPVGNLTRSPSYLVYHP